MIYLLLLFAFSAYTFASELDFIPESQSSNPWFINAQEQIHKRSLLGPEETATNIILFIGDGMGMTTITAARILEGQLQGGDGEENELSFDRFPYTGLMKTYNVNAQTPDSAGTMTAIMTGVKTDIGILGYDEDVERGDCNTASGNELRTLLELAKSAGLSTGIVSTTRITHATPAATYARAIDRNFEDDTTIERLVAVGKASASCLGTTDIATQLIHNGNNSNLVKNDDTSRENIDVVLGGGRKYFLPRKVGGHRQDDIDLIELWRELNPKGQYLSDKKQLESATDNHVGPLFGLFSDSHMAYEADRAKKYPQQPSLSEMTEAAIKVLTQNSQGYFLVVESGRIDHAHHAGNAYRALHETIELSNAVRRAQQLTHTNETLLIVTADHGHVLTFAGYPRRGNPILGKVIPPGSDKPALAEDGLPYTTLGYMNGRGFAQTDPETNLDGRLNNAIDVGRKDLKQVDTTRKGFHQEALVGLVQETHSGEDVPVYALGPSAYLVSGTQEQNALFHIIYRALNLEEKLSNTALSHVD